MALDCCSETQAQICDCDPVLDRSETSCMALDSASETEKQICDCDALLDNKAVAKILCMAPATIRVQRHLRRHNQPHWLTIDAIYVGSRPRYRRKSVACFLRDLTRHEEKK
jgi:hypothetical protein